MGRKKHYLILDVETANSTDDALVYDIGFQVVDRKGNVYAQDSMLIYEVYVLEKELMQSAYYAEKIPEYEQNLKDGKTRIVALATAQKIIKDTIKQYKILDVGAYNANFDKTALNKTLRYVTKSKRRWFFPYGVKFFCIWHMACQLLFTQKRFFKMAEDEGWFSPSGNLTTNAEICYRYLHNGMDFQEEHKGLDDVKIETEIFVKCLQQKKKVNWNINRLCWRIPTKKYKECA